MPNHEDLKNKPLVEAYVEIRWKLPKEENGQFSDPNYKFLLGRLNDRVQKKYPYHEPLPAAHIPDEMAPHIVQHRFRAAKDGWPIIQVGPGIFTANTTTDYTWPTFKVDVLEAIENYYLAYPDPDILVPSSIFLKYVDAIPFDYLKDNALDFLREQLKMGVTLPSGLFEDKHISSSPRGVKFEMIFQTESPKGVAVLLFATGRQKKDDGEVPAVVWHTMIRSAEDDVPNIRKSAEPWLDSAHEITHDWFIKFSEGDLLRSFKGE